MVQLHCKFGVFVLESDAGECCLAFSIGCDESGGRRIVNLIPNGSWSNKLIGVFHEISSG
jgi:hypothetical protein